MSCTEDDSNQSETKIKYLKNSKSIIKSIRKHFKGIRIMNYSDTGSINILITNNDGLCIENPVKIKTDLEKSIDDEIYPFETMMPHGY